MAKHGNEKENNASRDADQHAMQFVGVHLLVL
jgi:hypothetical protein